MKTTKTQYFVVLDGVGLAKGAKKAVDVAISFFEKNICKYNNRKLEDFIYDLNSFIINLNMMEPYTTICILRVSEDLAEIASLGDTRCYVVQDNYLEQITEDNAYQRNYLSKYLGKEIAKDDINAYTLMKKREYLLCTDGFYELFNNNIHNIHRALKKHSKATLAKMINGSNNDDATYIYVYPK